jgi:hypothetical protein
MARYAEREGRHCGVCGTGLIQGGSCDNSKCPQSQFYTPGGKALRGNGKGSGKGVKPRPKPGMSKMKALVILVVIVFVLIALNDGA